VNYFYAFVAPVLQRTQRACSGVDATTGEPKCDGEMTGQNMFFDTDTFAPYVKVGCIYALV
jgi:hypothetical protein